MDKDHIKKLLYKQLVGTLSQEEERQLKTWRKLHVENEKLYHQITSFDFLDRAVTEPAHREAVRSWERMKHRIGYHAFLTGSRRHLRIVAAACLLLLLGSLYWWWDASRTYVLPAGTEKATIYFADGEVFEINDRMQSEFYSLKEHEKAATPELSPDLHHTVCVPRGGEYTLTLADQTTIHLNAQSSLTIPVDFSGSNRSVNLSGEAYFEVKSDKAHPFVVETDKGIVTVTGTQFNVKNYKDEECMIVTLEEGEVEVNSACHSMKLVPGEQAVIDGKGGIWKQKVDTSLSCAWHRARIAYEDEPLINILTDLGRWYDFEAAYANDYLRNLRFSMEIDKTADFNEVAEMLERLDKIQIQVRKNNRCIITNK